MQVIDGFALLIATLAGAPLPPLPAIAGRLFVTPKPTNDDFDAFAAAWDAAHKRQAAPGGKKESE